MAEARQQAPEGDAVLTRIGQAVMLHRGGDREEARNRLAALWREIERDGAPFHRCALAHYLADTQDDPLDELIWDLRALAAADALTGALAPRAFLPSLHLKVAAGHLKLGQEEAARGQLALAREAAGALGEDPYGDGVRAAILRLTLVLEGAGGD
ncbi:hypothetical protein [Streptomyces rapamycinicus]|uniref:Tetratricopeptide repeat protein n=2 Tax=Streptomyces rapamycinicus TaxID=1226757 RepID=A0A0A0NSS0_STRRN|nr:hypothetical protein [Streptomyces rapamycinicus]AGP60274.1 hypothetical protein M271_44530 [Streptomyces rapamycinicus NRRL 5491]MBB4788562.1 hypothetical protein [Streptomyces rapamycinicus]RLV72894.1 hypothetical protein D3C57_150245 [Streptomyces rapamycinicus NRRL 5491]UTP35856.1 hypothetical protein LIV37_45290 [Streptomyces rapamycinicus NRRL 5491]